MDFTISERVQEIVGRVRQFVDDEVIPLEQQANTHHDGLPPGVLKEVRQRAKDAGLWGPQLPTALGGMGLSLQEIVPVFEAAGRSLIGPLAINCSAPDEGNMHLLNMSASDEQKERYLMPLVAGETRSTFYMTEPAPGAGADLKMLRTTAERDGDEWVINGHKWFATGADGAAFAIIMAVTNPDEHVYQGSSMFLAANDTPGIEIMRRIPMMGVHNPGGHCEIMLKDVRLPHSAILGEEGEGFALAQKRLGPARLTHCMRWTGIAQRSLEIATHYAANREAFGGPLTGHQAIQWMLADSEMELYAGRLMIQHAAWLLENGGQARIETSMAKVFVAETVNRVIDRAIQICGGTGISRDLPLSYWYEEARAFRIYDGPSEVHRSVMARKVIGKYGGKK